MTILQNLKKKYEKLKINMKIKSTSWKKKIAFYEKLQKTVDKFIHWVCNKFSVSSEDEFIKDFEFENDIYLDSEKQIENEEYEKDWNFEL